MVVLNYPTYFLILFSNYLEDFLISCTKASVFDAISVVS